MLSEIFPAAAEDLSKQFVAALAARRSIEPFAEDRCPPQEKVWSALTDRQSLSQWLMPNNFEPRVGHKFEFRTKPAPGFTEPSVRGARTQSTEVAGVLMERRSSEHAGDLGARRHRPQVRTDGLRRGSAAYR